MSSKHDIKRNACQLFGRQAKCGYDWWWHSFTAENAETGEQKPFYIEFFICNPKSGGEAPVFGDIAHHKKPSYLMVNVGTWGKNKKQLHRFFGWKQITVNFKTPYSVTVDDCYCTETQTHGCVKVGKEDASKSEYVTDSGEIKWDLKIKKVTAFNVGYGAGPLFRRLQAFEMCWHAEGMKSEFEGEVYLDGEKYVVKPETCYGYADKNWGRNFTTLWGGCPRIILRAILRGKSLKTPYSI